MNALVPAALRGEILSPDDSVSLVVAPHPLKVDSTRLLVPSGMSMTEIAEYAEEILDLPARGQWCISVEGCVIPPELWSRVRAKSGTSVVMRAVAGFGEGDFLKSVLSIAVVALSLVLPVVIFPAGGIAAALLGAAISIGGTLLINALFPVAPPQLDDDSRSAIASYSLNGGQNQADPFGVIPDVLGRHRWWPKLGAQWYTEFIGDDQFLRGLLVVGYGSKSVTDVKIGETPITSFDDYEIEIREGYSSDTPVTLYPNEVIQTDLSVDLTNAASWQQRTTATNISEISLDYVAGGGIYRYDAEGEQQYYTVSIRAEYRAVGDVNWKYLGNIDLTARSRDAIRRGMRKTVPAGQYEVRVRKTSADYTGEETVSESVVWSAIRGFRNDPPISFSKPLALIGIRIRANSQLNGVIQQLNCMVESRVKSWNGTTWVNNTASRNPADLFRYVLQSDANAKPQPDSKIDLETLQEWHEYCSAEGFTFDAVFDNKASVFDRLRAIAAAGRAAVMFRDGKFSVVWDQPDSPIVQHFTPRNSWGFSGSRRYVRLPHAWRVRFINEEVGYAQDERLVYDDGYSAANATIFEQIEFPGQTNPENVWRHGRFHIAQARLRPEIYSLNVDIEHLVCTRGDRVRVTHDVPMFGLKSGRVKSVDGSTIVLDEFVTMEALKDYAIRFRLADGSSLYRTVQTDDGDNFTITLSGTGSLPAAGDLWMFGEAGTDTVVLRVRTIEPGEELTARLTLVDDAPEISAADEGVIPEFESNISVPTDPYTTAPVNLKITEVLRTVAGGGTTSGVVFTWETAIGQFPEAFQVEHRDSPADGWTSAGTTVPPAKSKEILDLGSGGHHFRVRAIFQDGTFSSWSSISGNLAGLSAVPGDVENFRVQVIDDQSTLSWDPATGLVDHYVIRYAQVLEGATWGSATVLNERVDATSVQVPTIVGTFLIKAVTLAGVESTNATSIATNVAGLRELNVVETWQGEPTWSGTKTNLVVDGNDLRLESAGGVLDWPAIESITGDYWSTQFPYEYGSLVSDQIIDLGEIFTSRATAKISAVGDNISNVIGSWGNIGEVSYIGGSNADLWLVRLYESHTSDDPLNPAAVWTDYSELSLRDITARAFRFELRLYSLQPAITPVVTSAIVTIDMPDRVVAGEDVLSSAAGATTVVFSPSFRAFEGLAIVAQDMQTGDYYETYNKDETGFQIQFFNSAGTGVARMFDYVAKGYGKKQTA